MRVAIRYDLYQGEYKLWLDIIRKRDKRKKKKKKGKKERMTQGHPRRAGLRGEGCGLLVKCVPFFCIKIE